MVTMHERERERETHIYIYNDNMAHLGIQVLHTGFLTESRTT